MRHHLAHNERGGVTMKVAQLTEEDQQTLNQFEEKLGVVLVAYEPDTTDKDHSTSQK